MGAASAPNRPFDWVQWQRILYYDEPMWGTPQSMIGDRTFFLGSPGVGQDKTNHGSTELAAYLHRFHEESGKRLVAADKSVICRFPWRFMWLKRQGLLGDHAPNVEEHCPQLRDFLKNTPKAAVSIIFSSQYMGNPASYFGHTFLLLKREHVTGQNHATMLDGAISFSAIVANPERSLAYAWNGLTGGFKGYFTIDPFFMKVQEYNFLEQRDLWEYEIKMNQQQIKDLILALWEIKDVGIPYYYHSTNCTGMLQKLLAATDSRFASLNQKLWTSPLTLVRKLEEEQLIAAKVSRPSMYSQCFHKAQLLTTAEQKFVYYSLKSGTLQKQLMPDILGQKQRTLDVAADYIDYKERLAGNRQSKKFGNLRHQLLVARSTLGPDQAKPPNQITTADGPEKSHRESLVAAGIFARFSERLTGAILRFRPSFHEFGEPSMGIGQQNAIALLGLEAHVSRRYIDLNKITLISMSSHPLYTRLLDLWSWEFSVGSDTFLAQSQLKPERTKNYYIRMGGGLTVGSRDQRVIANLIPFFIVGGAATKEQDPFGAAGVLGGIRWRPFEASEGSPHSLEIAWEWQPSVVKMTTKTHERFKDTKIAVNWSYKSDLFTKIQFHQAGLQRESEVSLGYFF